MLRISQNLESRPARRRASDRILAEAPLQRRPEVLDLGVQLGQPGPLAPGEQVWLGALRQSQVVAAMAPVNLGSVLVAGQPFAGVLAHRLEHEQTVVWGGPEAAQEQLLVDQALQRVDIGAGDRLGGVGRGPAGEHREPAEGLAFGRVQEAVAPVDRCAQRLLTRGRIARAAAEHIQRARESAVQLFDPEQPGAGRRQLDGERQSVEPLANLRDHACVALRQLEACLLAARALHEQRAGGGKLQWPDAVEVLGL